MMISYLFWGSTILSLLAALMAILSRNGRYLTASAILYLPLAWYLSATPRFAGAFLLFLSHLLMAYVLYKRRNLMWVAWVAFVALAAFPLWLAWLVWSQ